MEDYSFYYMLLDRCRKDCDFFFACGNRQEQYLWGGDVKTHIAKMKELWSIVPEKPEWLSWQEILWFEKAMTDNENIVFVNWMMRYDMRDLGIFTENELGKLMKFQWFFVKDAASADESWTLYIDGKPLKILPDDIVSKLCRREEWLK